MLGKGNQLGEQSLPRPREAIKEEGVRVLAAVRTRGDARQPSAHLAHHGTLAGDSLEDAQVGQGMRGCRHATAATAAVAASTCPRKPARVALGVRPSLERPKALSRRVAQHDTEGGAQALARTHLCQRTQPRRRLHQRR